MDEYGLARIVAAYEENAVEELLTRKCCLILTPGFSVAYTELIRKAQRVRDSPQNVRHDAYKVQATPPPFT